MKLDVDGSSQGNPGKISFGDLITDNEGKWPVSFPGFEGIDINLLPELLAIKHGLVLAWNQGYRKIICNLDSINILRLIHDGNLYIKKNPPLELSVLFVVLMGTKYHRGD